MPYTCHRVAALPFMPQAQCPECVERASRPYIDTLWERGKNFTRRIESARPALMADSHHHQQR